MPKEFKYNVILLCQGVHERPCLWDKTLENYKDRLERRQAWEEIFNILEPNYEEMSAEEKRVMGECVLGKWTNIRDTFVKTLKTRKGKPKRRYLLYEHLKFLVNGYNAEEESTIVDHTSSAEDVSMSYVKSEKSDRETTRKKRRQIETNEEYSTIDFDSKLENNSSNNMDFVDVSNVVNDPRVMNEDEAFFASLLPTVVKYNGDERLEFRIEVLSVMKRINEKRKWPED